nr:hypothetical protein Iba_chr08dCG10890 [Ipomoea batatas]GMD36079.1 hypothetical protein Iba_chr09dCG13000 [Ipomoea batatas]
MGYVQHHILIANRSFRSKPIVASSPDLLSWRVLRSQRTCRRVRDGKVKKFSSHRGLHHYEGLRKNKSEDTLRRCASLMLSRLEDMPNSQVIAANKLNASKSMDFVWVTKYELLSGSKTCQTLVEVFIIIIGGGFSERDGEANRE